MKDRVVQYPNRYKITLVAGTTDTYDLEAVPGVVSEAGTPLNKPNLLADATAAKLATVTGQTMPTNPTVNDAFGAIANQPQFIENARAYIKTQTMASAVDYITPNGNCALSIVLVNSVATLTVTRLTAPYSSYTYTFTGRTSSPALWTCDDDSIFIWWAASDMQFLRFTGTAITATYNLAPSNWSLYNYGETDYIGSNNYTNPTYYFHLAYAMGYGATLLRITKSTGAFTTLDIGAKITYQYSSQYAFRQVVPNGCFTAFDKSDGDGNNRHVYVGFITNALAWTTVLDLSGDYRVYSLWYNYNNNTVYMSASNYSNSSRLYTFNATTGAMISYTTVGRGGCFYMLGSMWYSSSPTTVPVKKDDNYNDLTTTVLTNPVIASPSGSQYCLLYTPVISSEVKSGMFLYRDAIYNNKYSLFAVSQTKLGGMAV